MQGLSELSELEPLIVQEWMARPPGNRTEKDFFPFYGYLLRERAHLLQFHAESDKYTALKELLRKHL
jgi:hypothetical protein